MSTITEYRNKLEQFKGKRDQVKSQLIQAKRNLQHHENQIIRIEEAQTIIQKVAQHTQEELEFHISDIVSLALNAVFDEPYKLKVEFVIKRGKTECNLWFERDGELTHPLSSTGGGAVDVASFALRVALWSLSYPKPRNVLILDEPFKHLKGLRDNKRAIQMVKEVSSKLNLQIISISDERASAEDIEKGADRVFEVSMKKGISEVVIK